MPKILIYCDNCGKPMLRQASHIKPKYNTCSRKCNGEFSSKKNPQYLKLRDFTKQGAHFTELNKKLNPERARQYQEWKKNFVGPPNLQVSDQIKSNVYVKYPKSGQHAHRVVMEQLLGRPLEKGEVVHHINGNRHDNRPENLMLFKSQSEHAAWHAQHKGGDKK